MITSLLALHAYAYIHTYMYIDPLQLLDHDREASLRYVQEIDSLQRKYAEQIMELRTCLCYMCTCLFMWVSECVCVCACMCVCVIDFLDGTDHVRSSGNICVYTCPIVVYVHVNVYVCRIDSIQSKHVFQIVQFRAYTRFAHSFLEPKIPSRQRLHTCTGSAQRERPSQKCTNTYIHIHTYRGHAQPERPSQKRARDAGDKRQAKGGGLP
jgi:hypothetical protein